MFDDANLHDAFDGTDEVRVVRFVDVRRVLPPALHALNRVLLAAVQRHPSLRTMRDRSRVDPKWFAAL